jgi:hypothetical protein
MQLWLPFVEPTFKAFIGFSLNKDSGIGTFVGSV